MSATPLFAASEQGSRKHFDRSAWLFAGGDQSRAMELMTALQATLEVNQVLGIFSDHLKEVLPHSGIGFASLKEDCGSIEKAHQCGCTGDFSWRIQLYVADQELGWLEFYLDGTPSAIQKHEVERALVYLIHPLNNALRFDRMREQALVGELTGIGSRAALMRALQHEVSRARRAGGRSNWSLLAVDLDGFKQLNDDLGHLAGDVALRQVANAVKSGLRDCDHLFRYGGDEFVAILPNADQDAAKMVAARLEELVEGKCTDPQLRLSAGYAQWRPDMGPMDLFAAADASLYARKRARKKREARARASGR